MASKRKRTWCAVLWLTALTATAYAGQGPGLRLRYSPLEDISYFVERTMKASSKLNGQTEVLCEKAVVRYREPTVDGKGWVQVSPEVHLVSVQGTMQRLKRLHTLAEHPEPAFRPLLRYSRRGESRGRSEIHFIAREFDGFPIFPEKMVTTGDGWTISKRMKFPYPDCWFSAKIEHFVGKLERRNGVLYAKITYTLSGHLATAAHPELQSNELVETLKPQFTLDGKGSVWFDCSKGIIVEKIQQIRWSKASTVDISPGVQRRHPTVTEFDQEFSADISVQLISEEKAARLAGRKMRGAEKTEPALAGDQAIHESRYHVQRVISQQDIVADTDRTWIDRAIVAYGGAKPEVTYVDEHGAPLDRGSTGPPLEPLNQESLQLLDGVPVWGAPGAQGRWPAAILARSFDLLPIMPAHGLKVGKDWISEIDVSLGPSSRGWFTATLAQACKQQVARNGRRCFRIEYTMAGLFSAEQYPKRFDRNELREHNAGCVLAGTGLVHVDAETGVVIEKEQHFTWLTSARTLQRGPDDQSKWQWTVLQRNTVSIHLSLQDQ